MIQLIDCLWNPKMFSKQYFEIIINLDLHFLTFLSDDSLEVIVSLDRQLELHRIFATVSFLVKIISFYNLLSITSQA